MEWLFLFASNLAHSFAGTFLFLDSKGVYLASNNVHDNANQNIIAIKI